jgi:large subunit ribosomal protein L24
MQIRKGDTVYVRTGSDKGKTGRVLFVNSKDKTVVVEGVNMRKKHQKPTQKTPKGGVISIEGPIHLSNVALYNSSLGGPTRVSMKTISDGGKTTRVRICKKTGEEI